MISGIYQISGFELDNPDANTVHVTGYLVDAELCVEGDAGGCTVSWARITKLTLRYPEGDEYEFAIGTLPGTENWCAKRIEEFVDRPDDPLQLQDWFFLNVWMARRD